MMNKTTQALVGCAIGLVMACTEAMAGTNIVITLDKKEFLPTEPVVVRVTQRRGASPEEQLRFSDLMNGGAGMRITTGTNVVAQVRMSPIAQPEFGKDGGLSCFHVAVTGSPTQPSTLPPGTYKLTCTATNWVSNEVEFRLLENLR